MKHKKIAVVAVSLLWILNSYAQSADEIVNKYFNAIGGKEKVAQLKTVISQGEMTIMNNPAPFSTLIEDGKAYKNEVDFNGQKIVTCYINGNGWTVNPLAGVAEPVALPADQASIGKMTYDLKGPLYDYKTRGSNLELVGNEKQGGTTLFILKLTTSDGTEMNFYIDGTTWYPVKLITKLNVSGNAFELTTTSSNYQKTSTGVFMPFVTETSYPGLTVTATSKTIEVNKEIDPAVFAMPKK